MTIFSSHFSLRAQFNVAVAFVYLVAVTGSLVVFLFVANGILQQFAQRIAVKQAQLERNKIMTVIDREVTLARTLAGDPLVRRWAEDEQNPSLRQAALEQLENYRQRFSDKSVFLALKQSGRYYLAENDQRGEVQSRIIRRDHPADAWFFDALANVDTFALNLDHNPSFNVTKVWFNVIVRNAKGEKIGLGGGGIDLRDFLREASTYDDASVSTAVVDGAGVLQAWRDHAVIDFNAHQRDESQKITLFSLLGSDADKQRMRQALEALATDPARVEAFLVRVNGVETLAAVTALPGVGWYNVALVNASGVVGSSVFWPVLALLALSLLAVILIITWLLGRIVIRPLARLTGASREVAGGRYDVTLPVTRHDEIGQLTESFNTMTAKVLDYTSNLESMVQTRTQELSEANASLMESRQRIMESLRYARTIQESILPRRWQLDQAFAEHMSLYLPRDIVGGDLLFLRRFDGHTLVGLLDCTGHGVPGAFMAMTVHSVLNHVVNTVEQANPAVILRETDRVLRDTLRLRDTGEGALDCGLDMALCAVYPREGGGGRVLFSGAGLSLFKLDSAGLSEIKGDKLRLGYRGEHRAHDYAVHELPADPGDRFYCVTDGFLDEGGGKKGYSFGSRRFQDMLESAADEPLAAQAETFKRTLEAYRGDRKQRDDIAMIGFSM